MIGYLWSSWPLNRLFRGETRLRVRIAWAALRGWPIITHVTVHGGVEVKDHAVVAHNHVLPSFKADAGITIIGENATIVNNIVDGDRKREPSSAPVTGIHIGRS